MRILLLTTAFPPSNLTGARRPYHMARMLQREGHEVTVVHGMHTGTNSWPAGLEGIRTLPLALTNMPPGMPLHQRLLARLYHRLTGTALQGPLRVLADLMLPLDHGQRWDITPDALVRQAGPQDLVIATGPSWSTFDFGHHFAHRTNKPLVLDYRDPWSIARPEVGLHMITHMGRGLSGILRRRRMRRAERKFAGKAVAITAATPLVLQNALEVIGPKPAWVVYNGFTSGIPAKHQAPNKLFTAVYLGSAYREQEWDIVQAGLSLFAKQQPRLAEHFNLIIAGARTEMDTRLNGLQAWMESNSLVTPMNRLGQADAVALQAQADLFLHVGFKGKRGIFPIKFIEYLGTGIPILQASTGTDLVEEALNRTGAGLVAGTPAAFAACLAEQVHAWLVGGATPRPVQAEVLTTYSWEHQARAWHAFLMDRCNTAGAAPATAPLST